MLHLLLLPLSTPALAAEPAAFFAPDTLFAPSDDAAAKGKGKGKSKNEDDGGKKNNDVEDDLSHMKGKLLGLNWEPFVEPGGGVQINGKTTAVTAGADVGIRYWKKKLKGELYLGGTYITADNLSGYDVHLGDQTGYRAKMWGAGGGVEVTYNGQTNTDTGKDVLKPALGVKVPVQITVGPKKFYGKAGVTPAWYFDDARKPSAGQVPFGDEFEWNVAAGLKLGQFKGEVGFAQLITSAGTYNTPTINVGWNP